MLRHPIEARPTLQKLIFVEKFILHSGAHHFLRLILELKLEVRYPNIYRVFQKTVTLIWCSRSLLSIPFLPRRNDDQSLAFTSTLLIALEQPLANI